MAQTFGIDFITSSNISFYIVSTFGTSIKTAYVTFKYTKTN